MLDPGHGWPPGAHGGVSEVCVLRWLLPIAIVIASSVSCVGGVGGDDEALPVLPFDARVELTDVALVWPLPPGTGAASGEGFLGPVLSCADLAVFEPLTRTDEPETLCEALTVTAARLDPCFKVGGPDAPCQSQLRLVLQPVVDGEARDASIHVFMGLNEPRVIQAVARMMALRLAQGLDGRGPLGVHPLLDDVEGRIAVAEVVRDALAQATLQQFTQITVHGDDAAWTFEFRAFEDGAPTPGEAIQQHVLSQNPLAIDVSVTPSGASADDFSLLLKDDTATAATVEEQQRAWDHAARVEHPSLHDTATIDCARCHLAAPARATALARTPTLQLSPDAFSSTRHDLTPTAVFANPQFIHAFAWRHTDLAINSRVLHEAATSADLVEASLHAENAIGALP